MATTHSQNSAAHSAEGHHTHGTMDVTTQERTFAGFVRLATWSAAAVIVILIFLALSNV
jgi:hypothetical protein